jgi:hypothetical protein
MPRPDLKASSGTVDLSARVTQKQKQQNISGKFALSDLTGQFGNNAFQKFGITSDLDVEMTSDQVQIHKLSGNLVQDKTPGGAFDVSGNYGLNNKTAQLTARLTGFNQNGLRPFLEPMLTDKKLVSVALNGNAAIQYDPNAASSIKADLQVTNLVVNDPKGQFPSTPLGAKCQLDAVLDKKVVDIHQCQLALTPTSRATNSIGLTGHLDMSDTNATQGNLKLASDSLDFTSYYDLFGGQKKTAPAAPGQASPHQGSAPTTAAADTGLQTNQLPLRNFTADAAIHRLYLHEVDISDFQLTTKIDGGRVVVNPFKLTLNGAPISANVDLDMGIPGYKYALSFNAQSVPLAPLVDSFQPDRKGQLGGTFTAQTKISGTGTADAAIQKTLAGQFDISSTNLNLSVVNIKSPVIKTIVNTVATIPDLLKNPETAVGSLLQGLTGKSSGGLTDELSKSPINSIIVRGTAGAGKANLQQASIQSSAFRADATGTVTLASILTNSTINIPVSVSLSQPIARQINVVSADTPTNAPYAKLPDFLTETGTVGNPKAQINKIALLSLAAKGIGGAIPGVGGTAGNLIQGVSGLLGGNKAGGTNSPNATTNGPGLLQGLGGLLGGNAPTNTNAPAPPATNQAAPLNNLLNNLFKK